VISLFGIQAMPMIVPGLAASAILAYLMTPYFAGPFDFRAARDNSRIRNTTESEAEIRP
jgi:hypothetical protein